MKTAPSIWEKIKNKTYMYTCMLVNMYVCLHTCNLLYTFYLVCMTCSYVYLHVCDVASVCACVHWGGAGTCADTCWPRLKTIVS